MVETILIAFAFGKIKGYKLTPLFKSWTIYPVLVFSIFYVILEVMIFNGNYEFIKYSSTIHLLNLLVFLILIIKYRLNFSAIIGGGFIFIGSIMNNIAISSNNGKMPIFPTLSYMTGYFKPDALTKVNDIHILGDSTTKLKFLTDIFDVGYSIMSIGDIFIRFFVFIIIFSTIKAINSDNRALKHYLKDIK